jgi:putative endonuclease
VKRRSPAQPAWWLYVVRTERGELYTGVATDVARRLARHRAGRGAKYLRGRGPLELVYRRRLGERGLALRVERRVKRLPRAEKERLVLVAPSRSDLLRRLGVAPPPRRAAAGSRARRAPG